MDWNDIINIMFSELLQTKIIFFLFELLLFCLPIIPSNIYVRLVIIIFYFLSHQYRVQYYYANMKKEVIAKEFELVHET